MGLAAVAHEPLLPALPAAAAVVQRSPLSPPLLLPRLPLQPPSQPQQPPPLPLPQDVRLQWPHRHWPSKLVLALADPSLALLPVVGAAEMAAAG